MILYSRTLISQDPNGNLTNLKTLTPNNQLSVNDMESIDILNQILKELKIANLHNSVITDNVFTKQEIE